MDLSKTFDIQYSANAPVGLANPTEESLRSAWIAKSKPSPIERF